MRDIPDPGFADDDGSADPALLAALAGAAEEPVDALAALAGARLLVPVTAVAGEVETGPDGLAREKDSDMAVVLMRGRDGRLALLAFTGQASLRAWDPGARPVPVSARTAASAALQDGAAALLVDLAGPSTYVLQGDDLTGVAEGWRLATVAGPDGPRPAWIRPGQEQGDNIRR